VNIITRPAGQTTGTEGVAALGSLERAALAVRHGGSSAETTNYRVYGKTFRRIGPAALAPDDDERWTSGQVGFRVDGTRGDRDAFSVQGALLGGRIEDTFMSRTSFWPPVVEVVPVTTDWLEHNALARYERNYSEQSAMSVQAYYQVSRQVWEFDARKRLFDVEVQRREAWGARHDFVGGAGYRVSRDRIVPTPTSTVRFANVSQTNYVANAFLQDEIAVVPSRVWFTAGVKAEYNEYTGTEWQPTTRLLYAPNDDVAAWAAVSRAVRTPDRTDRDLRVDFAVIPTESGTPTVLSILGNPDFDSETVVAYETGFRWQHGRRGLIDLTTFFNEYSRLRAAVPVAPFIESEPQPEHLVVAERYANVGYGIGYGSEVVAHWEMTRGWRLTAGYSWLRLELDTDPIASAPGLESVERQSPRHHVTLRSQINLGRSVEWDVSGARVSELAAFDIPGYTRIDMRVGWTLGGGEELSIGMENMFDAGHYEFGFLDGIEASPVQRNTYARLSFRL
jgi:iron complex outermembrane receptor protein